MQEALPLVSVIIPVYRDEERLALCLGALAGQSYSTDRIEVIVVDNGCDRLQAIVDRFPGVMLVEEESPGSYAARNCGIRAAQGSVYAFTDADCVPSPTWIAAGVAALTCDPRIGIVGGRIEMISENPMRLTAFDLHDQVCGLPQRQFVERLHFAATANLFSRERVFADVGIFSNELKSSGDREWALRVRESGYRIVYADEAVVRHPTRRTLREFIRRRRRITGGWWQVKRLLSAMNPPRHLEIPSRISDSTARLRTYAGHSLLRSRANKLRFLGTEVLLYLLHLTESTRLRLGGQPTRR